MTDGYDATRGHTFGRDLHGGTVMRAPDRRRVGTRDGVLAAVFVGTLMVTVAMRQWLAIVVALLFCALMLSQLMRTSRARVVLYDDRLVSVGVLTRTVLAEDVTGLFRRRVSYSARTAYLVGVHLTTRRGFFRSRWLMLPGLEVNDAWSDAREQSLVAWQVAAVAEIARRWSLPAPEEDVPIGT